MMGLVLKNLRQVYVTPWNVLIITIVAAVAGFIIPWAFVFDSAFFGIAGIFSMAVFVNIGECNEQNWQKLEAVMPLTCRQVVLSKYLSYVILFAILSLFSFAYLVTNYSALQAFCECYNCVCISVCNCVFMSVFDTYVGMFLIFFLFGAVITPLQLRFPHDKANIALYIGVILVILVSAIALWVILLFDLSYMTLFAITIGFAVVMYVCSYFISLRIYRKKSF